MPPLSRKGVSRETVRGSASRASACLRASSHTRENVPQQCSGHPRHRSAPQTQSWPRQVGASVRAGLHSHSTGLQSAGCHLPHSPNGHLTEDGDQCMQRSCMHCSGQLLRRTARSAENHRARLVLNVSRETSGRNGRTATRRSARQAPPWLGALAFTVMLVPALSVYLAGPKNAGEDVTDGEGPRSAEYGFAVRSQALLTGERCIALHGPQLATASSRPLCPSTQEVLYRVLPGPLGPPRHHTSNLLTSS
ncbi:hypothetical protein QFZ23_000208 [Arthrobacter globiformis]|nr:hypothetical protein [Arthrobacter globiformis]